MVPVGLNADGRRPPMIHRVHRHEQTLVERCPSMDALVSRHERRDGMVGEKPLALAFALRRR
jgi:hypothetical protein